MEVDIFTAVLNWLGFDSWWKFAVSILILLGISILWIILWVFFLVYSGKFCKSLIKRKHNSRFGYPGTVYIDTNMIEVLIKKLDAAVEESPRLSDLTWIPGEFQQMSEDRYNFMDPCQILKIKRILNKHNLNFVFNRISVYEIFAARCLDKLRVFCSNCEKPLFSFRGGDVPDEERKKYCFGHDSCKAYKDTDSWDYNDNLIREKFFNRHGSQGIVKVTIDTIETLIKKIDTAIEESPKLSDFTWIPELLQLILADIFQESDKDPYRITKAKKILKKHNLNFVDSRTSVYDILAATYLNRLRVHCSNCYKPLFSRHGNGVSEKEKEFYCFGYRQCEAYKDTEEEE